MENNFWDIAFSDLLIAGEKISGKGEDAYLNAEMGVAAVLGFQGGAFGSIEGVSHETDMVSG